MDDILDDYGDKNNIITVNDAYDIIVVGGGLAGVAAAMAASRQGCKTALVQDRPVLGGNCSSEIRVPILDSTCNPWAFETGIIAELFLEDRARNHRPHWQGFINSIWDLVLYEGVKRENNLTLFLNTSMRKAVTKRKRITGITCIQLGSENAFTLEGRIFIDASGDGALGAAAGADYRMGREAKNEFDEPFAPDHADDGVMGSSLMFRAKDVGHPIAFTPPSWAVKYENESDLAYRAHRDTETGYWWIEIGHPFHTIHQNETIKDELLRHLLGVWDHIKNRGDHKADNLALDWVGMVPGKRESRRFVGDHILSEPDVRKDHVFPDRIAHGGFPLDIHCVGGILNKAVHPTISELDSGPEPEFVPGACLFPYSIPLRSLYSRNITNLMFAGRNISVTHVALGTTRVMATCGVIGQAAGTAAALCRKYNTIPPKLYPEHIQKLQQQLIKDDVFIPNVTNEDSEDLAKGSRVTSSSNAPLVFPEGKGNCSLDIPRGQLFPVSNNIIEEVDLLLESKLNEEIDLQLGLRSAKNVWDLTVTEDLTTCVARIPAQKTSWVNFQLNQPVCPHRFYWIWLEARKGLFWRSSDTRPVATAPVCQREGIWYWAKYIKIGSHVMDIRPQVNPYLPENIVSGMARPSDWTNLWVSNPDQSMPHFVEMNLGKPKTFDSVHLTFDINLSRPHYSRRPGPFRAPECVRDYSVFYREGSHWTRLFEIRDNYQRHRRHRFPRVTSDQLRIEFYRTNGCRSVHVYEVRLYHESGKREVH